MSPLNRKEAFPLLQIRRERERERVLSQRLDKGCKRNAFVGVNGQIC